MENSTNIKIENFYKLFLFSISLSLLAYGFALTNYTLTIDNEIPILSNFGMDLGRWGQNLIRYHIFNGHLQYFSLVLSLFLFSLAAVRLAKLFKFEGVSAYFFCGLFVTFPQIAYQVVFGMMADIAGLGILLSAFSIEFLIKGLNSQEIKQKIVFLSSGILIAAFTLSLYQAFIIVLTTICIILFFQSTFESSFDLKSEIKKLLFKGVLLFISIIVYFISVKIICPPIENSSYLSSFVSGGESNNNFLDFCFIWFKNLVGSFYYGERLFVVALLLSVFLFIRFFIDRKVAAIRFLSLFLLLLLPFIMSIAISNGYHPPRLYVASNLVFAFVIAFSLAYLKLSSLKVTKLAIVIIATFNIYFITNLFYTANKIYKHDKRIAEKIDDIIQIKYPQFSTSQKTVYFYGYFPYEYHQRFRLDKSEIFGGSYYNWDNGNNYRINKFFEVAAIAEYRMIETKEQYLSVKDSIEKMPTWPDYESIKMINNVVIVKLGKDKGMPISVE